jgi:hypothetical protein
MKTSHPMPLRLFFAALFVFSSFASAGDFSVRVTGKERSNDLIYVDRSWRKDLPQRLKVAIRAGETTPANEVIFKAYFFDSNGRLLRSQNEPSKTWTNTKTGISEVGLPDPVPSNKLSFVFLALPEQLKDLKTTIVVFGRKGQLVADLYPSGTPLDHFEFPEKAELTNKPN